MHLAQKTVDGITLRRFSTHYRVKGRELGRASVFCRFSGCNLWSGREEDRVTALCNFCDTDFVGVNGNNGGRYSACSLAKKIMTVWNKNSASAKSTPPYLVCTGGEPLLQFDDQLLQELHNLGIEVAIETNGTIPIPLGVDWVTVSPKANTRLVVKKGNELKLVYPQSLSKPIDFESLEFEYFFIQPMDGPNAEENVALAAKMCMNNPIWRLSLQTHKLLGLQ